MLRRDKIITWVMASLCVLSLVAVGITVFMLTRDDIEYSFNIEIDGKDDENEVLEFTGLGLVPGGELRYTAAIYDTLNIESSIFLVFDAKEPQPLADFVYVRIIADGKVLCDRLLSALLARDSTTISCHLPKGGMQEIEIIYYMPVDVGDEAKHAEANFSIIVTVSNGWEDK